MITRMTVLLAFLAAFMFTTPAFAAPPEEDAKADTQTDEKAPEAGTEAKTEETKGDEKGDGPAVIGDDEGAVSTLQQLVTATKNGHWSLVMAFGLMLVVYLLNKLGITSKLGAKAVPWIAAGTGVAGYVSAALMIEGTSLVDGVTAGVMTGAAAVGLWELIFKHILGKKSASSAG
jgi:hypothetical protein